MRDFSLGLVAVLFVGAGALHFVVPDLYVQIVPPYLPFPLALVYISGVAEVLGGIGVLIPKVRAWAGWGLIALLIAVFPANLYMALEPEAVGMANVALGLWLRLPLQFVLIAWVWWTTQSKSGGA